MAEVRRKPAHAETATMEYRDMSLLIFSVGHSYWDVDCALLQAEKCNMLPRVPMLVRTGKVGQRSTNKWLSVGNDGWGHSSKGEKSFY